MKAFMTMTVAALAVSQVACAASNTKTTSTETKTTTTTTSAATTAPAAAPAASSAGRGGFVEDRLKFKVTGMHCGGCADSIKEEVEKVPGVAEAQVDFKTGDVVVISSGPSKLERAPVIKAIESAGTFKVKK
ncbi:MAG: heavy metal-associated domain-containing protein [Bdellovibrionota bacterium]